MQRALSLYETSIGKKAVMALSGVGLLGFAIAHLLGNLTAYNGAQAFNDYAASLRTYPALLWTARIGLIGMFSVHIATAFALIAKNRAARTSRYQMKKDIATSYAAKAMPLSGITLLCYVVFHLAHLTFGAPIPGAPTFDHSNAYNNMVGGFENPLLCVIYAIGTLALGMHLFHGIWSMFQSMGLNHPKYNRLRRDLSVFLAAAICAGFLSFPIAVQAGLLEPTLALPAAH